MKARHVRPALAGLFAVGAGEAGRPEANREDWKAAPSYKVLRVIEIAGREAEVTGPAGRNLVMPQLERLDKKPDYDGQEKHELSIDKTDAFTVHPIRRKPGLYGLHVQNAKCDNVISLWGLTEQQLRDLHDDIARSLGLPSAISPAVLRNLHRTLTEVLDAHDRAEASRPGPFDEMPPAE